METNMGSMKLALSQEMNNEIMSVRKDLKILYSGINNVSNNLSKSANHQDTLMQDMSKDIRKLSTEKNASLAGLEKIPQLVEESSVYTTAIADLTKVQKKQNSLIINNSASLIELKELFSTTQADNVIKFDSIKKGHAEMLELYNSAQTEKVKRFNSIEKGQAEIMNLLSTLINNTKFVQEGATGTLGNVESLQGGATKSLGTQKSSKEERLMSILRSFSRQPSKKTTTLKIQKQKMIIMPVFRQPELKLIQ